MNGKGKVKRWLLAGLACCCVSFASAGTPPLFSPTGIALSDKGELVMSEKGMKRVDVFSPDGKELLRSFPVNEIPTGVIVDGDNVCCETLKRRDVYIFCHWHQGRKRLLFYWVGSMYSDVRT